MIINIPLSKKKINWKKIIIIGTILKLISSLIIITAIYFFHKYYHTNEDLINNNTTEFSNSRYDSQIESPQIQANYKNIHSNIVTEKNHSDLITQEELQKILANTVKKNNLILLNDFYQLKFNVLNQKSNENEIKKFHNKFLIEFPGNKITNNLKEIENNFSNLYTKYQIIEQIKSCLEKDNSNYLINVEKISERNQEKENILNIINKIEKEEWKTALDLLHKEDINENLTKNRQQIIQNIQIMLMIENNLKSIENFLQDSFKLN